MDEFFQEDEGPSIEELLLDEDTPLKRKRSGPINGYSKETPETEEESHGINERILIESS